MQAALVERLLAPSQGRAVGYKVACTNKLAQDLLRVDGPFCGRLLSPTVHAAPARLVAGDFVHRVLEAEFAFEMSDTVPASAEPYTAASIAPFLGTVLPAIEIVEWHYADWTAAGALSLIADNAIHGAWIMPGSRMRHGATWIWPRTRCGSSSTGTSSRKATAPPCWAIRST